VAGEKVKGAYYNENDAFAAAWLRNLISAGHIAPGDVDERSIVDVKPDDLRGYTQCHFFAGIGGWSYALRLAGWPDDRPVWTGSCPCQPFSSAGEGKAFDDERHLWPSWLPLIEQCAPSTIFGEQVEAAIGRGWLDVVLADLEEKNYACGASVLPACSVGAPHIRQRAWFVAYSDEARRLEFKSERIFNGERTTQRHDADRCRDHERLGSPNLEWSNGSWNAGAGRRCKPPNSSLVDNATSSRQQPSREGAEGQARHEARLRLSCDGRSKDHWSDVEYIACSDGKSRPVKSGIFPLAYGVSGRVGKLRAPGNAIVPQVAAQFIIAAREAMNT
jgi:DNA (cytosine-5)-methyltransferase 1